MTVQNKSVRNKISLQICVLAALAASTPIAGAKAEDVAEVSIQNFLFEPADVSVKSGTRIVFRNKDQVPHSIVGEIGGRELFRSPDQLGEDETYAVVASNAGEISYYCGLHPGMKGKISVSK
jgi:plastocyanin